MSGPTATPWAAPPPCARRCGTWARPPTCCPIPAITDTYAPYAAPYCAPEDFVPAHVVSADIAALSLLPDNAAVYAPRIELAIDHHPSGFFRTQRLSGRGRRRLRRDRLDIIALLTPLTPEIALPLYVAIATDTGCFIYSNTTARTHRIAAALMDTGIDAAP